MVRNSGEVTGETLATHGYRSPLTRTTTVLRAWFLCSTEPGRKQQSKPMRAEWIRVLLDALRRATEMIALSFDGLLTS
jgi:hypothetical protein